MDRETGLAVLRPYWWVIVLFTVVGAVLGALPEPSTTQDSSVSYQATHTLLMQSTSGNLYSDPVFLSQIQLFATIGEVPKRAAARLGVSVAEVAVSPALDQTNGAFSITASGADPQTVVEVADTVADELTKYIGEYQDDQINNRLAANRTRQGDLVDKIRGLEIEVAKNPDDNVKAAQLDAVRNQYVVVLQQFDSLTSDQTGFIQSFTLQTAAPIEILNQGLQAPKSRSSRGLFAGVAGLIVGVAIAFVLGRLDRRIRTRAQAETVVGMRSQVSIPVAGPESLAGVVVLPNRHDPLSDAYRSLRSVIEFAEAGEAKAAGRIPVIVVVSPTPGDGKTSVSANLAVAFVESGRKTIAVNADFRRPALVARLSVTALPDLTMDLDELAEQPATSLLNKSSLAGLAILDVSSVKAPPGDLARVTAKAIPEFADVADVIVVDTSPMTATAEVLELIPTADVVVMVMRINQTPTAAALRAIDTLRSLNPRHLLLTVVGESAERSSYYYKFGNGPQRGRWWRRRR